MFKSISLQLFASFLALTLIVLGVTLGLARWSFEAGFLNYINTLEKRRLTDIAEQLEAVYAENDGSWGVDVEVEFQRILLEFRPRGHGRNKGGRPPPPDQRGLPPHLNDRKPPPHPERRRSARFSGLISDLPPTRLLDPGGARLASNRSFTDDPELVSVPILFQDETVAVLESAVKRRVRTPEESEFSKQQWQTSAVIAVICLLLAGGVSWFLASGWLRSVRQVQVGISNLAAGEYGNQQSPLRADEFGELVEKLNRLAETLQENKTARQRWLADISHELRTPTTILVGELEAIKDGVRDLSLDQLHSFDHELQRLKRLIDDLYELSLSDIGGLRYRFTRVRLDHILQDVVDVHMGLASEAGLTLNYYCDSLSNGLEIIGDRDRLVQLFTNIVRNSIAYTDAPGQVRVSLNMAFEEALIVIEDSAPSVNPAHLNAIFHPLFREDQSRARRSSGGGLGLAIVKNISRAHRGRVVASPSDMGGLRLEVRLPLQDHITRSSTLSD
ncbi:MAG: ATP-binding protein [Pseudomonadota bacterium]